MTEHVPKGLEPWARAVAGIASAALLGVGVASVLTTDGGIGSASVVISGALLGYIALANTRILRVSGSGITFDEAALIQRLVTSSELPESVQEAVAAEARPHMDDLPASVRHDIETVTRRREGKRETLLDLCIELEMEPLPLGVGSSIPSAVFRTAAERFNVNPDQAMPDIAGAVVAKAGMSWDASHWSAGSTVTARGLRRFLEAVRELKRRSSGEPAGESPAS